MFSQINNLLYGIGPSVHPVQQCKPLSGIADLIDVMALTKICPAYNNHNNHVKIHRWKEADMLSVCEHFTYFATSCDARYTRDTPIPEIWTTFNDKVQQVMTNLIPLKRSTTRYDQTWENTAIKWLAQRKKKAFTK